MPDDPRASILRVIDSRRCCIVCVLAVASLVIAFLGATPARVSATELLGETRAAGDAAFIASHRGGGATAPENTLPAIAAALGGRLRLRRGGCRAHRRPAARPDARRHGRPHDRRPRPAVVADARGGAGARRRVVVRRRSIAGTQVPDVRRVPRRAGRVGPSRDRRAEGRVGCRGRRAAVVAEVAARNLERRVAISSFDARTLAHGGGGLDRPAAPVHPHASCRTTSFARRPRRPCAESSSIAGRSSIAPRSSTRSTPPASASSSTRSTATRSGMRSPRSAWTVS